MADNNEVVGNSESRTDKTFENLPKSKKSKIYLCFKSQTILRNWLSSVNTTETLIR